jgi:hypothetical protein
VAVRTSHVAPDDSHRVVVGSLPFYWAAVPKSEPSAALTTAGAPPAEQGHRPSIDGSYLAVSAEEGELDDKPPPNAALLTELVLVVSYGTVLGWLLAFARRRRSSEVHSLAGRRLHSLVWLPRRRAVAALLGVFRL